MAGKLQWCDLQLHQDGAEYEQRTCGTATTRRWYVTIFPKNDSLLKLYCEQLHKDKQVEEQLDGWRPAWREQHQPNQFGPSAHAPNPMPFPAHYPPTTGFIHPMHQQTLIPSANPIAPPPPPPTRTTPAPPASASTLSQTGKHHMCGVCGQRKITGNGHKMVANTAKTPRRSK